MSLKNAILVLTLVSINLLTQESLAATEKRKISVTGSCVRSVAVDRASIVLTADFTDNDLKTATKKATEAYDRTAASIRKLGLESLELKTAEYSLREHREWENNKSVFKGYKARMGLKVSTSSISRMGEVISLAAKEGLRDVGQLNTYLSEEKIRKEQLACLNEAAKNAKEKAEKLAASLDAQVTEILNLAETTAEQGPRPPVPIFETMSMRAKGSEDLAPPKVEPGQQEISVSVQATFGLK